MKTPDKNYWNAEEYDALTEAWRGLARVAPSLLAPAEWRQVKHLVRQGIRQGDYARDAHGISQLLLAVRTAWVLYDKVGLGKPSLLTVMLDPMVEAGHVAMDDVRTALGDETARLMAGMSRVKALYKEHDSLQDENFRKLLISMAEDIRVIICLIADRYVLMKLLNHNDDLPYRLRVTEECRLLYTPMAHRLGLYALKSDLEDMAVKYEHRDVFDQIAHDLNATKSSREAYIQAFIAPLEQRLRSMLPVPFTIKGRTKSISSIWHKLKAQNTTLERIYDLFAIRIIIDAETAAEMPEAEVHRKEKALCWQAYSVVTDLYTPNPKRLKDWIDIPKSNGYESLHITVKGPESRWVEVQIRTRRMDEVAERGLAAHWKYKGIKSQGAADQVMASIREILENNSSPDELMKDFSTSLYQEEIFVFTPTGDVHKLPKGATVLDFAFSIHTGLGSTCVGARVGHKNVKLNYPLRSGDTVEVLTAPSQTPKRDWLGIVVTSKARVRIKQALKEIENREAEAGKEMLQRRFKNRKVEISDADMARLILRMNFKTQTLFFHALAEGDISVDDVLSAYDAMMNPVPLSDPEAHGAETFSLERAHDVGAASAGASTSRSDDVLVIDKNLKGLDYKLAGCCHPIYGDDVTGFVTISGGISIHRSDCVNLHHLSERYPYRIVRARWAGKSGSQYSITLRVVGHDDIGIVSNISSLINKEKDTSLRAINIDTQDDLFQGHLTVMVNDLASLKSLVKKIQGVKGVKSVERIN